MANESNFTEDERAALHSIAEIFSDKESRDELRRLLDSGTTIRELVMVYKTNRRVVSSLKAIGGLVVLFGAVVAAVKALGFWPVPK